MVIDLGEVSSREVQVPAPPPVRRRSLLMAAGLLLLGLLTGATHRGPPDPPTVLDARIGDLTFVHDDRLFVVGAGPPVADEAFRMKIISEYALPAGRLLSRTTVAVDGAIFNVVAAGAIVLVSYQVGGRNTEATVALTGGTERALWRRPARMVGTAGDVVLLRQNIPEVGGQTWTGVALRTGEVRWTVREPVRGFSTLVGPGMLLTADDRGELNVRDTRTGAITARRTVPLRKRPLGADVPVWPVGDLVLTGAPGGTTAYALPGLAERWRSGIDLNGRWVQPDCAPNICSLSWQGGLWLLDRATGALRWSDDRWNYAEQAGPYLLATDNNPGEHDQAVSVVEDGTGRVLGDFGRWHSIGALGPDGTMVGLREQLADDRVWYARLDPATRGIRVIGMADQVSGDCQTTPDVLVCRRIDATVGLWPLK